MSDNIIAKSIVFNSIELSIVRGKTDTATICHKRK